MEIGVSQKQKILFVHHAGGFGGAPKSLSFILKNLDTNAYSSSLINISKGPINDFFRGLNIDTTIVNGIRVFHGSTVVEKTAKVFVRNWLFLLPSIYKAIKIINNVKPTILHLNSTCLFAFAIAARLSRARPYVICHVREPLRKGIWGAPLRYFCNKFVDAYIAISKFDLDSLSSRKYFPEIKKEVVYNFINMDEYAPGKSVAGFRKKLNIKDTDVLFIYLARLSKSNGWDNFIRLGKELAVSHPNYHFALLGATDQQLKDIPSECNNIHILPFSNEVVDILRECDVFVCPFVEPHFARGVIEASAVGVPILASNVGGVNELVVHNQTGFLYNSDDEFKKFAVKVANDPSLRQEMGLNGRRFAALNFNQDENLKRTYSFYDYALSIQRR